MEPVTNPMSRKTAIGRSIGAILITGLISALLYTLIPTSLCGSCPRRSLTFESPGGSYGISEWEEWDHEYGSSSITTGPNTVTVTSYPIKRTTRLTTNVHVADQVYEIPVQPVWLISTAVVLLLGLSRFGGKLPRYVHFVYLGLVGLILVILLVVAVEQMTTQMIWITQELQFPFGNFLLKVMTTLAAVIVISQVWMEAIRAIREKPMKYFGPSNPVR